MCILCHYLWLCSVLIYATASSHLSQTVKKNYITILNYKRINALYNTLLDEGSAETVVVLNFTVVYAAQGMEGLYRAVSIVVT